MAESQDGSPDASKPPPAAIPDLRKAQENKTTHFVWAPGAARSAASAAIITAPSKTPTTLERPNSTPGRLAVLAFLMLIGGAGLSVTAYLDSSVGGAGELGGIKSTIKSRAFQGRDSVGLSKGYGAGNDPAARKRGMNFDLIKAGEKAMNVEIPEMAGAPGADGEEPMNYDNGATSGAGAGSGASAGKGGVAADEVGAGGGPASAPKLGSSYGRINFQGMRRVSGTAGFRGIKAPAPARTIKTRGSAASSAGSSGRGGAGSATSPLTPFSTNDPRAAGALSGKTSAGKSGAAADGGGGGGGGVDLGSLENTVDQNLPSVPDLLAKAASKREAAEKEEKKAKILASGGHFAQAHYHYDRAEKNKKEAEKYEDQAAQQVGAIKDEAGELTEQNPPAEAP